MEFSKKKMKQLLFLITFTIALTLGLYRLDIVGSWTGWLVGIFMPPFVGFAIAFVLRVPLNAIERTIAPAFSAKKKTLLRPCSLALTLLAVIGVLAFLIFLMIPEIENSVQLIRASLPQFQQSVYDAIEKLFQDYPDFQQWCFAKMMELHAVDWTSLGMDFLSFLYAGDVLDSTVSMATSVIGGVSTAVLGFIFSLYFLSAKENSARGLRHLLYAMLPEAWADKILYVTRLTSQTFADFFSGQCLEACILTAILFLSMTLSGMPYAMVVAVLCGVLSLIPIFGAFVGCAVGMLLIVIVNPMQAVWFLILFLVIQQVESNLIYPRVVGGSIGLPPMFVLLAVTLGGSMLGMLGMITFIPLFSVLYQLVCGYTKNRLAAHPIAEEKLENKANLE